jgi:glucans biosynthesis protein C
LDKRLPSGRIVAVDYLRGFVTILVVFHHSVLAYCQYSHFDPTHYLWSSAPIVDGTKWLGFDLLVWFNDGYFMPLMFLLSGLFVWPSLNRRGSIAYFRDRVLRLGLPFAIAVVTVIPLAYYPSFRMTGVPTGFAQFWTGTILVGPWPGGPAWFLGVLLAFDFAAALIHWMFAQGKDARALPRPLTGYTLLVALSVLAYLPFLALFGPTRWFAFGPFEVQASRVGLYAAYFLTGIVAGRRGMAYSLNPRGWARWSLLTIVLFCCLAAIVLSRMNVLVISPLAALMIYGLCLVLFCAAANFALFSIFARFVRPFPPRRQPVSQCLWDLHSPLPGGDLDPVCAVGCRHDRDRESGRGVLHGAVVDLDGHEPASPRSRSWACRLTLRPCAAFGVGAIPAPHETTPWQQTRRFRPSAL